MKLNQIKIGALIYEIVEVEDTEFDHALAKLGILDPNIKSFVNYDQQVIMLRSSISRRRKDELIIHELLHAMLEDAGFIQTEESEKVISSLAPRLNEVLWKVDFLDFK